MNDRENIKFPTFPELKTNRLHLRQIRPSDAEDVLAFRGDWQVQKFNGPVYTSLADAKAAIQQDLEENTKQKGISWAVTIKETDQVIGSFSFHHWSRFHRKAELGFDLARAHWGKGFATETLQAIIPFGFEYMHLNRIYANTIADNHASVRLLEKSGFKREGTQRQASLEDDGAFHDSAIYGLLKNEKIKTKNSTLISIGFFL